MLHRLILLGVGSAFAFPVWAFDSWPQWLGPNRDAVSHQRGLRDHWDGAPPLVWKTEGVGDGYAGPVVQAGVVCTMGDRKGKTAVIALSDKDGKEIWATEIGVASKHYTGSKSTPAMDGERIYAVDSDGRLVCLKTATGECVWSKSYRQDFDGRCRINNGYSESPLVDGEKLICSPGGREAGIVALDKISGRELWRCATLSAVHGSPVVSRGAGIKQYVQRMNGELMGIEAETGRRLWSYQWPCHYGVCSPIVRNDYVFGLNDGSLQGGPGRDVGRSVLLKLTPENGGDVTVEEVYALEGKMLGTSMGNAVLVGNHLYASDNRLGSPQCIELLTGRTTWVKKRAAGASGCAAVVYVDGNLCFHYWNGVTLLIAARADNYQLRGRFQIPRNNTGQWSYPAVCNGRLYLRSGDVLYCYDLKK